MQTLNHQAAVSIAEDALTNYQLERYDAQQSPTFLETHWHPHPWTAVKVAAMTIMKNTRGDIFTILARGWYGGMLNDGIIGLALTVGHNENQAFFDELVEWTVYTPLSPDMQDMKKVLYHAIEVQDLYALQCLIRIALDHRRSLAGFVLNFDGPLLIKMPAVKIIRRSMTRRAFVDILITWARDGECVQTMRRQKDLIFECVVLVGDGWREYANEYIGICESILTWNMAKYQYIYRKMDKRMFRAFSRLFDYGVSHVGFQTAEIDQLIRQVLKIGDANTTRLSSNLISEDAAFFGEFEARTIQSMLSVDPAAGRLLLDEKYLFQAIRHPTRVHTDILALIFTRFGYDDNTLGRMLEFLVQSLKGSFSKDYLVDMLLLFYSGEVTLTWDHSLFEIASLGSIKLLELVMRRRGVNGRTGLARINERDNRNRTALQGACFGSRPNLVDFLLDHNASIQGISMRDAIRSSSVRLISLLPGRVSASDMQFALTLQDPDDSDFEEDWDGRDAFRTFHIGLMTALKAKGASLDNVLGRYTLEDRIYGLDVAKAAGFDIGPYEHFGHPR
jgi:hypothetical protein